MNDSKLEDAKPEEAKPEDDVKDKVKEEDAPTSPKRQKTEHKPRTVLENLAGGLTIRFNRRPLSPKEPSRSSSTPARSSSAPAQPSMGSTIQKVKNPFYREVDDDIQILEFVTKKRSKSPSNDPKREANMQKAAKLQQRLTGDSLPNPTLVIRRDHNYQVHNRDGRSIVQDLNFNRQRAPDTNLARIGLTNNVPQEVRVQRERNAENERVVQVEPTERIHGPRWPRPPTATLRHGNQMIISEGHQPSVFIQYAFGNQATDIPFAQPPDERSTRPQPCGPKNAIVLAGIEPGSAAGASSNSCCHVKMH